MAAGKWKLLKVCCKGITGSISIERKRFTNENNESKNLPLMEYIVWKAFRIVWLNIYQSGISCLELTLKQCFYYSCTGKKEAKKLKQQNEKKASVKKIVDMAEQRLYKKSSNQRNETRSKKNPNVTIPTRIFQTNNTERMKRNELNQPSLRLHLQHVCCSRTPSL